MPLLGTRGAASAKGFGFAGKSRTLGIAPWVWTQTNNSVGSTTVNLGQDFGTNSTPKGTIVQYNGINTTPTTLGVWIPQRASWKPYNLNYFISGTSQPNLTSYGWTNGLYPSSNSSPNTTLFNALLSTRDIEYGSYVGDGTSSRKIPHSLQTWAGVVYCMSDGYYTGGFRYDRTNNQLPIYAGTSISSSFFNTEGPSLMGAVADWSTDTTFRVVDPCNVAGRTYYYVAMANQGESVYCGTYNVDSGNRAQTIGFTYGSLVTKGSLGGNYSWQNPFPISDNSNTGGNNSYNSYFDENGATGQASETQSWQINSTGFTAVSASNGWYSAGAGNVYYWAIKKTS